MIRDAQTLHILVDAIAQFVDEAVLHLAGVDRHRSGESPFVDEQFAEFRPRRDIAVPDVVHQAVGVVEALLTGDRVHRDVGIRDHGVGDGIAEHITRAGGQFGQRHGSAPAHVAGVGERGSGIEMLASR